MSVAKIIEIKSEHPDSFEAAIKEGISRAQKTVENVKNAWVKDMEVTVEDGEVTAYRVALKITFVLH